MSALLLAPHNDDETLFASFTILRHRPHVVTCFRSYVQERRGGPDYRTREAETQQALFRLGGPTWQQLPVRDDQPDVEMLVSCLREIQRDGLWDVVFAPAVEDGGHDQHNMVGHAALEIFGDQIVTPYLTYVRGEGKTRSGCAVPFEPDWPARKLMAMSKYQSQIEVENTSFWFLDETIREWYA